MSNEENKTHLTAITRKKLSAPCKYLKNQGLLQGKVLDYGCGRGEDCSILHGEGYEIRGYDPHYRPVLPKGKFDTIFCIYVLNVIPDVDEREAVLSSIRRKLKKISFAYVVVRAKVKEGWTKRGTWQGNIYLDLPLLTSNSNFRIYEVTK